MNTSKNDQTLTFSGKDYTVVAREEFEALRDTVDQDEMDIAVARRILEDADEELVPFELAERIAAGVHPVRIWREYRGMTASNLATESGIAQSYLSDIETGKKPGSVKSLKRIATALGIAVDDLI